MVPILDEVSTQLKDKIIVAKIDTEKYPEIASHYDVEALPTFVIFRDGKPCYRFVSKIDNFFTLISLNSSEGPFWSPFFSTCSSIYLHLRGSESLCFDSFTPA